MPHADVAGLRMYYEWHGRDADVPLVLVAGVGGDATVWPLQLTALTPEHRCLVFDNRDAGRTGRTETPYTVRQMAGDLLGLLDVLGVARAHLLGVSLGGAIAQEAALAAPARIASLQLHATWPGPDPYFRAVVGSYQLIRQELDGEAFLRALFPWMFTAQGYAERPEFLELLIRHGAVHPYVQPAPAYLRQTEAALGHDARARLPAIRCPTLVTVGAEDILTPPRLARELAALIPGARLEVLPGGHGYFWESPEPFNAACREFLAGLPPAHGNEAAGRRPG